MIKFYCSVFVLWISISFNAFGQQLLVWDGSPLPIDLSVGHTRILDFGKNVRFNKVAVIQDGSLEAFSLQGKLYLTASTSFSIQRMRVSFIDSGFEILLDISALKSKEKPQDIIVKQADSPTKEPSNALEGASLSATPLGPIDILRFASLDSYAPDRLKKGDSRFTPYPVNRKLNLSELFIGQSYGLYESKLIKAWQVQGLYLTVVGIRNLSLIPRQLNLFDLNLDANLASPQRVLLAKKHDVGDSTRFYVITKQPFEDALGRTPIIVSEGL